MMNRRERERGYWECRDEECGFGGLFVERRRKQQAKDENGGEILMGSKVCLQKFSDGQARTARLTA
jgi:hypothetical protein